MYFLVKNDQDVLMHNVEICPDVATSEFRFPMS